MYSKDLINQIKLQINIVDVIGDYQSLTKRGKHYVGICPFHADSTPSLTVNPAMQIYKCFACGASGDVISYVQHAESCTFTEALQILAKRAHIELPEDKEESEEDRKRRMEREKLKQKNAEQQESFIKHRSWSQSVDQGRRIEWPFADYLRSRHISQEAADAFGLGYAVTGEFRERITYPLYTASGVLAGWTGRRVGEEFQVDNSGKRFVPKYKNSAESELFHKDELLFGLKQAIEHIRKEDRVYIVEGQNDVIRMWMSGRPNTVAGSGTAFSEKQARLLQRYTQNVVLMYDGDAAGMKATERTMKVLLGMGFSVWVCCVPEGEDPDSWLLALSREQGDTFPRVSTQGEQNIADEPSASLVFEGDEPKSREQGDTFTRVSTQGEQVRQAIRIRLENRTKKWIVYLMEKYACTDDADKTAANAQHVAEMIACVPNRLVRQQLAFQSAVAYKTDKSEIQKLINKQKVSGGDWQQGLYGIDEAVEMLKSTGVRSLRLTFNKDIFIEHLDEDEPWVLWQGEKSTPQIQQLRQFPQIEIDSRELDLSQPDDVAEVPTEGPVMGIVSAIHRDSQHINILRDEIPTTFTDTYVNAYSEYIKKQDNTSLRTEMVRRCMDVIADTDATEREVNSGDYRLKLQLSATSYKKLLQDLLSVRKDKREAERKRLAQTERTANFNFFDVPEYVENDEVMKKQYEQYGFFPLLSEGEEPRPVAYVFKGEKGEGHSIVSDFYMEALLFVDPATDHSKRVIKLNHRHGGSQYVEWPSDVFVSLTDIKKRLFASGAYNFNGTPQQWDRIRQVLSYNFTECFEARVFGWQPEGFLMLPNAVYYRENEDDESDTNNWRLQYMDNLGVAEVNDMRFYSPASSSIRLGGRVEDNPYEQDEFAFYLEATGKDRIDFTEWATLMNEVFKTNENGKWAVMFAIACNFRDFIYSIVGNFTALCFAGPTGSGKTELAYAIRGLWMRRKASVFNLNSGTDAAFFMTLEHFRNMPVIMEEYNDNDISMQKFQGLKAAVYDDQGRVKVKDLANKSTDSSKTNAAPILLGQDTPQQDDGSLSNRVIICEVPPKEDGFSLAETEKFDRLKRHSELGLGNVLCEIIRQRPLFERYYKTIYAEEVQRLKRDTWQATTNKEGLERVIRSVAIMSATARLIEERGTIRLPWRYAEFYHLATEKITSQMESISTTSKLGMFFEALNTLLSTGRVVYGRDLMVVEQPESLVTITEGTKKRVVDMGDSRKVLYLHLGNCYSAYCKEVTKGTLTKQTLTNYFRSNQAYVGPIKSIRFRWTEAEYQGSRQREDGGTYATMEMVEKVLNSSAYAFNYDTLRKLYDIDYERGTLNETAAATSAANNGSVNTSDKVRQMSIDDVVNENTDNDPFA